MGPLATAAIDRIVSDDVQGDGEDDLPDRVRLTPDAPEWARVLRQVDLVDAAITYRLKQEIELMARLRVLAGELKLESVAVLPRAIRFSEKSEGAADDLLSEARERAIYAFLETWLPAINGVRSRWEERRDDA